MTSIGPVTCNAELYLCGYLGWETNSVLVIASRVKPE